MSLSHWYFDITLYLSTIAVPIWVCNGQYKPVKSSSHLLQSLVLQQILTRSCYDQRIGVSKCFGRSTDISKHMKTQSCICKRLYSYKVLKTLSNIYSEYMLLGENLQKISRCCRTNPFSSVHLQNIYLDHTIKIWIGLTKYLDYTFKNWIKSYNIIQSHHQNMKQI